MPSDVINKGQLRVRYKRGIYDYACMFYKGQNVSYVCMEHLKKRINEKEDKHVPGYEIVVYMDSSFN